MIPQIACRPTGGLDVAYEVFETGEFGAAVALFFMPHHRTGLVLLRARALTIALPCVNECMIAPTHRLLARTVRT